MMKTELNITEIKLCKIQGELFVDSLRDFPALSSTIFIRRFMTSDIAFTLDELGYLPDSLSLISIKQRLKEQLAHLQRGTIKMNEQELYWIGYLYRYWSILQNINSRTIYGLFPPGKMREVYPAFHSLDPRMAISRICESISYQPHDPHDLSVTLRYMKKARGIK